MTRIQSVHDETGDKMVTTRKPTTAKASGARPVAKAAPVTTEAPAPETIESASSPDSFDTLLETTGQPSAEQTRIAELEAQLAALQESQEEARAYSTLPADLDPNSDTITFPVVEDGFTAFDRVWYRGQEFEITKDSEAYRETEDRFGRSWLEILDDHEAQYKRYGKIRIQRGYFRGRPNEKFTDVVAQEDAKRGRQAPKVII